MCNSSNNFKPTNSNLQNSVSLPSFDKLGLVEKIMQFPSKGKFQSFLFFATCLPLAILAFVIGILFVPFWSFAAIDRAENKNKQ